jgi:translation initiation factor 1A
MLKAFKLNQFEYLMRKDLNFNEEAVVRAPLPKGKQVIGILEERYGGNKMKVSCLDGKERNCRVPGRLKRALWLRPGDVVIVEPWELDFETRGDIILKYKPNQIAWLRKNNFLENESEEF